MTEDKALDLAQEALKLSSVTVDSFGVQRKIQEAITAITAIKQARSAPVQEPVWIRPDDLQKAQRAPFLCRVEPNKRDDFVPLYTTPPAAQRQWVGLTDEDIGKACGFAEHTTDSTRFALKAISRAIEAKLKELNT